MEATPPDDLWTEVAAKVVAGTTKVEVAYEQVRRWILVGNLAPGAVLDQGVLAAAVGVSTTPMREALRRLEAEMLLSIEAHRRVVVSPLSRRELDEIYAVRLELDPLAARLAASRITNEAIAGLRPLIEMTSDDVGERLALNRQFHATIYRASENAVLARILDSLHDRATRYRMILMGSNEAVETAYAEHREILDALERRAASELARLTRAHLAEAKAMIEQSLVIKE